MNIRHKLLYLIPVLLIPICSCTKSDGFTVGSDFIESNTSLEIIDTFRVELSTVILDSVNTSGTGIAIVGGSSDDEFGSINSLSYFELAYTAFSTIEENAIFDSSAFILGYSGYYYGDTLSLMSLSIHQLTERIIPFEDSYLYNNTKFNYSAEPLGTRLFYPEPNSSDTAITLPVNAFGRNLFDLIRNSDINTRSEEYFLDYMKGFIIRTNQERNKVAIGFLADESHIILKLYYHLDKEEPEEKSISIPLGQKSNNFNSVEHDFSDTELAKVESAETNVLSEETANKAYLQGLTGILPKLEFPTIQDIFLENRWKILKAELVFEPVTGSYDHFNLPENLYLYETDKYNNLNGSLEDAESNSVISSLYINDIFGEDTRYTFDITYFITEELSDSYFNSNRNLFIGLGGTSFTASFDRILVEGKNPPVKLRLYYLSY